VVHYRKFRNTDPPGLVTIWNEVFVGHGGIWLANSSPLERCVFSKPYFDPDGLVIAEEDGAFAGFVHAGFGVDKPGAAEGAIQGAAEGANGSKPAGVICLLAVRPQFRRRRIGSDLLRQGEAYLQERGAAVFYAGPHRPRDPFYLGLYGGSNLPGFLVSQPEAEPFLTRQGYGVAQEIIILRRRVRDPVRLFDARVASYRQQYELRVAARKIFAGWWQECVFGAVEPLEFSLVDKASGEQIVRALVWYMEGFGDVTRRLVGIVNLEVKEGKRRQGLGKLFLSQIFRALEEEYFEGVEIQVEKTNTAAVSFCLSSGFGQVDVGRVYVKER
jgi:ribosomal protein S18 acetylase RimI-like enzyme